MSDEGFHEIQLNGKQLVFLFMAATVVAVVIFLCGVMVGRGVQVQQSVIAAAADSVADPTAATPAPAASTSGDAPLSTQETLTYTERLEDPNPAAETLRESPEAVSEPEGPAAPAAAAPPPVVGRPVPPPAAPAPAMRAAATPPPAAPAATVTSEPAGTGFVVQVAAVNERGEADAIARRLSGKGYPAFVTTPAGAARVFRVRVGKYQDRRQAESIAGRLEKEEQFKPWITR
jgi:cell division septation protein DedD